MTHALTNHDKKKCITCGLELKFSVFRKDKKAKTKVASSCLSCEKEYADQYRNKNRSVVRERNRAWANTEKGIKSKRKSFIKRMYGSTPEEIEQIKKQQNNSCAICKKIFIFDKTKSKGSISNKVCIDHKHGLKKVRGLLCGYCNIGLGNFKESIPFLEEAISYLKRSE